MVIRRSHAGAAIASTFRDLKNHSNTTLFTAGVLLVPSMGTAFLQSYLGSRLVTLFAFPVVGAFGLWLQSSMIGATFHYATGTDTGVGRVLARSSSPRRLLSLFGVQVILFLLWTGAIIVAMAPAAGVVVAGLAASNGEFTRMMSGAFAGLLILTILIGTLVLLGVGIVISFRYAVAAPVNVLERLSPLACLARSRRLLQKRWPDLLLLFLILMGIGLVGALALLLPAFLVSSTGQAPVFSKFTSALDYLATPKLGVAPAAIVALANYLFAVFITPISVGAMTNFYLGIRADEAISLAASAAEGSLAASEAQGALGMPAPG